MAKSRLPGKPSSSWAASAKATLTSKCRSLPLKKLIPALGSESKLVLVGGSVREALLGTKKVDLDLASVYTPEKVKSVLGKSKIRVYQTGLQHGTVTAVIGKENIEITTFRKAGNLKGKKAFSKTIQEDLKARDFTLNAIAFDLFSGKFIDPLNGMKDLKANLIKACGKAELRFKEDPLRILRMVRFGPANGRKIEKKTLAAAKKLSPLLKKISIERVRLELEKILMGSDPASGIKALAEYDLLKYIIPELIPAIGFEQNEFHNEDVFDHTLSVIRGTPPELRVRLAALFHDIGKPASFTLGVDGARHFYLHEIIGQKMCKTIMKRLKFSNQEIKAVSELVRLHMRPLDCGPAGVRRLMRDLGDNFEDWKKLKIADNPPAISTKEFRKQYNSFLRLLRSEMKRLAKSQGSKLAVNGHDLIKLGEKPGKRLGSILKSLENIVIENPELNDHTILLEKAKELMKSDI